MQAACFSAVEQPAAALPMLQIINLENNSIGTFGCKYLA